MNESTARAERFNVSSVPQPSYTWAVPQKPISVCFPLDVIDRLEHEAVESFRSLSSRGSEIGGVLFGTVEPGSPTLVNVLSYDLVICDYNRGPLYRLSDADLQRFSRTMDAGSRNGLIPVGFFRSHTRKGLSMDPDDVALLDSKFKDTIGIALLIRPFATKPSLGGVFFREDGSIRTESSWLEFPFRASELSGRLGAAESEPVTARPAPPATATPKPAPRAQIVPIASRREIATPPPPPVAESKPEPEIVEEAPPPPPAPVMKAEAPAPAAEPARKSEPAPKPQPAAKAEPEVKTQAAEPAPAPVAKSAPVPQTERAAAEPTPSRGGKIVAISVVAALAVVASVALFVYPGYLHHAAPTPSATVQDTSPLALRVERGGGELVLTWNRDSAAIRNATHAVLSITDGDQHENVDMDLSQLRGAGSISYSPLTSDVVFRMEVTGPDQARTTSESVRVLRTRPSPMEDQQQQQSANAKPAPAAAGQNAAQQQTPASAAAPAAAAEANADQPAEPKAPAAPLKHFNPGSLAERLRPTRPADLPAAPALPQTNASSGLAALNLGGPAVAPPPPPPASVAPTPAGKKAVAVGGQIQQAQLLHRKDPEYPRLAKEAGARGIVEVIATIGTDGKVKAVQVVKGHPLLQRAAVDAVKQWVYKPTILNGVPVETQTQIFLNFVGDR